VRVGIRAERLKLCVDEVRMHLDKISLWSVCCQLRSEALV